VEHRTPIRIMKFIVPLLASGLAAAEAAPAASKCTLENCILKSKLAASGPGHLDGVKFFAQLNKDGKDMRKDCPFGGGDDEPEPSKQEYLKYMKGLDKVADMPIEQRRAYAQQMQDKWLQESEEPASKEPRVDVTKPGVHAVNSSTWRELRRANKFDFLITFYAPWCPHCKHFVLGDNAPINALSNRLEKAGGPKVVTFDMTASTPPLSIESVPTIYLFKKTGEAIRCEEDQGNPEALMAFALDRPKPPPAAAALIEKTVKPHSADNTVPAWKCNLENCALKSPLATAGPGFLDGVKFFATGSDGKDTRRGCPFGGGPDEPEPSKKEYMKYMNGLDRVGDMTREERVAYAQANEERWMEESEEPEIKEPRIDVTKPGPEALNSTTWAELRNKNAFDFLITFYAPWCPHCKAFVLGENAPINALSDSIDKANGPKVVTFDITADDSPLNVDAVPTVFLFRRDGQAIQFEGNPHDLDSTLAFALDNATPKKQKQEALVVKHLRAPAH